MTGITISPQGEPSSGATPILQGDAILERYRQLETLLLAHAPLWQPVPFHEEIPSWAHTHPDLHQALLALDDAQTAKLEDSAALLTDFLARWLPDLETLQQLVNITPGATHLQRPWPFAFERDIPGRKWAQIEAFSAALQPASTNLLDWCAGKGHLARSIAWQYDTAITGLERDTGLCNAGNALSAKTKVAATLCPQDVMATDAPRYILPDTHAMALHACGRLHLRLMDLAVENNAAALSVSPCCYHLIDESVYTPRCALPDAPVRLHPTRDQLRLAVQETVTANGRTRQLRQRKSAFRLGFAAWQRHNGNNNLPAPLPVIADQHFHHGFVGFCVHAASLAGISLPEDTDYAVWETQGWQHHARIQRLDLLRHAFRRPLELWLVLDRAGWLLQHGFEVQVTTFCNAGITPRNLLIEARRGV